MKRIETSTLNGLLLDWATAKALGHEVFIHDRVVMIGNPKDGGYFHPTTDWRIIGSIIDNNKVDLSYNGIACNTWNARLVDKKSGRWVCVDNHENALIAACHCFVKSIFGSYIDIPMNILDSA